MQSSRSPALRFPSDTAQPGKGKETGEEDSNPVPHIQASGRNRGIEPKASQDTPIQCQHTQFYCCLIVLVRVVQDLNQGLYVSVCVCVNAHSCLHFHAVRHVFDGSHMLGCHHICMFHSRRKSSLCVPVWSNVSPCKCVLCQLCDSVSQLCVEKYTQCLWACTWLCVQGHRADAKNRGAWLILCVCCGAGEEEGVPLSMLVCQGVGVEAREACLCVKGEWSLRSPHCVPGVAAAQPLPAQLWALDPGQGNLAGGLCK